MIDEGENQPQPTQEGEEKFPVPETPVSGDRKLTIKLKIGNVEKGVEEDQIRPQVNKNTQSKVCIVCNKEFSSGKALGGHIKVHFQDHNKAQLLKQFRTHHQKPIKLKKQSPQWGIIHPRENRNCNGVLINGCQQCVCLICRKRFSSLKALFGHMRCHSERERKGTEPCLEDKSSPSSSVSELVPRKIDDVSDSNAAIMDNPVIDLMESLPSWSVTDRRTRRVVEDTLGHWSSEVEKKLFYGAVDELVRLAHGDSFDFGLTHNDGMEVHEAEIEDKPPVSESKKQRIYPIKKMRIEEKGLSSDGRQIGVGLKDVDKGKGKAKLETENCGWFEETMEGEIEDKAWVSESRVYHTKKMRIEERGFSSDGEDIGVVLKDLDKGKGKGKAKLETENCRWFEESMECEIEDKFRVSESNKRRLYQTKKMRMEERGFSSDGGDIEVVHIDENEGKGKAMLESEDCEWIKKTMSCRELEEKPRVSESNKRRVYRIKKLRIEERGLNSDGGDTGVVHKDVNEGKGKAMLETENCGWVDETMNCREVEETMNYKCERTSPSSVMISSNQKLKNNLSSPIVTRNDPNKYQCTTCNRCYSTKQALGGHMSYHKRDKNFQKTIDESSSAADEHKHHPNQVSRVDRTLVESTYQCEICKRAFLTVEALGGHKRKCVEAPLSREASPGEGCPTVAKVFGFDLNELPPIEDGECR